MTILNITAATSGGSLAAQAECWVRLMTGGTYGGSHNGTVIGQKEHFVLDNAGAYTFADGELAPNSEIDPEGTIYHFRVNGGDYYIQLPDTGEYDLSDTSIWTVSTPPALVVAGQDGDPGPPGGPSLSGDLGDRPAAAATDANTLYFAEDTATAYHRPTTAVWQQIAPPVDALDDLDELANGVGTVLDTGTAGFVSVDRHAERIFSFGARASTTSEVSLLQATVDFPPNTFANNNPEVFGQAWVGITNSTGSNRDVTIRLKLDTTTVYTVTLSAIASNASQRTLSLRWSWVFGDFLGSSVAFGGLDYSLSAGGGGASTTTGTVPANAAHTLSNELSFDITAQMSFSSSSLSTILQVGTIGLRSIS